MSKDFSYLRHWITREGYSSNFPGLSRQCNPHDVFISGQGYQCGNCMAFAEHSWNISHPKVEGVPNV